MYDCVMCMYRHHIHFMIKMLLPNTVARNIVVSNALLLLLLLHKQNELKTIKAKAIKCCLH